MSAREDREYNDEVQWYRQDVVRHEKASSTYPGWWERSGKRIVLGFLAGAFLRDMF
jgi:hypothetical protein